MPKIIDENAVFREAVKVLVARGYDRATTQEMAAAAGIHEATLFRKYGSKVGLIERAVEHLLSEAPMSKVRYTGDLQADLAAILESYIATTLEYGEIIPMVLLEIPRYSELANVLKTPMANIQGLVSIIARYQEDGVLKEEPPLTTVNVLLAPILMAQMLEQAHTDMPAPKMDIQGYIEAFLEGRRR